MNENKYYIETYGCQMNVYDSELVANMLQKCGFVKTDELNNADATMIVYRHETQNPFGVIETKKNNFISYHEKPIKYENINAGIYIFESDAFNNRLEEWNNKTKITYLKDENKATVGIGNG